MSDCDCSLIPDYASGIVCNDIPSITYVISFIISVVIDVETCLQCAPYLSTKDGWLKVYNVLFVSALCDAIVQFDSALLLGYNQSSVARNVLDNLMDIGTSVCLMLAIFLR